MITPEEATEIVEDIGYERVEVEALPRGLEIEAFTPSNIEVTLEVAQHGGTETWNVEEEIEFRMRFIRTELHRKERWSQPDISPIELEVTVGE